MLINTLNILLWYWVFSFLITSLFFFHGDGKNFIQNYYNENFSLFSFEFYKIIVYLAILIISPIASVIIVLAYIKGFIFLIFLKIYLCIKLIGIKNKEIKKLIKQKIKEVKL